MAMRQPSKLVTRVRFPSPALRRARSSMAEHRPHKALVDGSNPSGPTLFSPIGRRGFFVLSRSCYDRFHLVDLC